MFPVIFINIDSYCYNIIINYKTQIEFNSKYTYNVNIDKSTYIYPN
jgi:hypothetical protein